MREWRPGLARLPDTKGNTALASGTAVCQLKDGFRKCAFDSEP